MIQTPFPVYSGTPFIRPMTVAGDTTGTFNAIGNYSTTPTDFYYQVPAGAYFLLWQVTVVVSTTSSLRQDEYGDITGGLTNGLKFFASFQGTGGAEIQLLAAQNIKTNNDFYVLTFQVEKSNFSGTPQTLTAKFDAFADYGVPLNLV